MDVKDEILLRQQHSIKAKDSYIDYLQRLLKIHNIDFEDINSITPNHEQAYSSELTRNELYKNASAKDQIDSQSSEYLTNSKIGHSCEVAITEKIQRSARGAQNLLRNTANSLNPSGHNMTKVIDDNPEMFCYRSGITLIRKDYKVDAFIVIDKEIVWYGADFIEGVKRADVILRLESLNSASELLEK
ncbi:hypothetical protein SAMN02745213_01848 [Succinivibrio dextrinosolvens DSM 3072]|uniref:Uncharacterized protein n=1 Tax=Succinivibrio dextrinosolvens DSM 3072 TaxID=1123324 RepID=A0A1T4VNR3_9GAMM|nr:hypothetical protein [Succinivibrio dextrinosolvens]SKA66614.1 hypothetical protein SAMN02745213_01848 [Succinivibrio dextrinosolvens DSM 3072]